MLTVVVQFVLWAVTLTSNATSMQIAYQNLAQMKAYVKQLVVKMVYGTEMRQMSIVEKFATIFVAMIATALLITTAHLECALILIQSACQPAVVTVQ
jgi:hypothetical protein